MLRVASGEEDGESVGGAGDPSVVDQNKFQCPLSGVGGNRVVLLRRSLSADSVHVGSQNAKSRDALGVDVTFSRNSRL